MDFFESAKYEYLNLREKVQISWRSGRHYEIQLQ